MAAVPSPLCLFCSLIPACWAHSALGRPLPRATGPEQPHSPNEQTLSQTPGLPRWPDPGPRANRQPPQPHHGLSPGLEGRCRRGGVPGAQAPPPGATESQQVAFLVPSLITGHLAPSFSGTVLNVVLSARPRRPQLHITGQVPQHLGALSGPLRQAPSFSCTFPGHPSPKDQSVRLPGGRRGPGRAWPPRGSSSTPARPPSVTVRTASNPNHKSCFPCASNILPENEP